MKLGNSLDLFTLKSSLIRNRKIIYFITLHSRSATVGMLEDTGVDHEEEGGAPDSGRGGSVKSSAGSRSEERLLDGPRSPDYVEQQALDQLLAPVLTKALLQGIQCYFIVNSSIKTLL